MTTIWYQGTKVLKKIVSGDITTRNNFSLKQNRHSLYQEQAASMLEELVQQVCLEYTRHYSAVVQELEQPEAELVQPERKQVQE